MQKLKVASALAVGLLSAAAASAAQVTLDFNGTTSFGQVTNFYNGGTDSAGAAGANYGVSFAGSVLALANDGTGPGSAGQFFTNAPTTNVIMANAGDEPAVMNVAGGFTGTFGVTYSSIQAPTVVNIWSGLNGTGTLLSTFSLGANSDGCDMGSPACLWSAVTNTFSGTAESVDFSSNAGNALFTNLTLSTTPVPLPAAGLLLSFGLSGLGLMRKRRRAA